MPYLDKIFRDLKAKARGIKFLGVLNGFGVSVASIGIGINWFIFVLKNLNHIDAKLLVALASASPLTIAALVIVMAACLGPVYLRRKRCNNREKPDPLSNGFSAVGWWPFIFNALFILSSSFNILALTPVAYCIASAIGATLFSITMGLLQWRIDTEKEGKKNVWSGIAGDNLFVFNLLYGALLLMACALVIPQISAFYANITVAVLCIPIVCLVPKIRKHLEFRYQALSAFWGVMTQYASLQTFALIQGTSLFALSASISVPCFLVITLIGYAAARGWLHEYMRDDVFQGFRTYDVFTGFDGNVQRRGGSQSAPVPRNEILLEQQRECSVRGDTPNIQQDGAASCANAGTSLGGSSA